MEAMSNTAAVMQKVNASMNPAAVQATMANFQKQLQHMDLNTDQLDEFLEDAFEDDEVEEEADEIVAQTLVWAKAALTPSSLVRPSCPRVRSVCSAVYVSLHITPLVTCRRASAST